MRKAHIDIIVEKCENCPYCNEKLSINKKYYIRYCEAEETTICYDYEPEWDAEEVPEWCPFLVNIGQKKIDKKVDLLEKQLYEMVDAINAAYRLGLELGFFKEKKKKEDK